jgi:hypothetical protein
MKTLIFFSVMSLSAMGAMAQVGFNTRQYDTGTIGLAPGQTARLNVLYPTAPAPIAQILCSATLSVIANNASGTVKTETVQLSGGKTATVTLNADTDLPPGTGSVQIRGVVLTPAPATAGAACNLVPTLELVDNVSSKTTVVVKGEVTFQPQAPIPTQTPALGR